MRFVSKMRCLPLMILLGVSVLTGCSAEDRAGSEVAGINLSSDSAMPADASAMKMGGFPGGGAPPGFVGGGGTASPPGSPAEMTVSLADGNSRQVVSESAADPVLSMPRRIIYTADTRLTTKNFTDASKELAETIKKFGGHIANSNVSGEIGSTRFGNWTVRIPVQNFDAFLGSLGEVGSVQNTSISSQDVSEEYYDLEARLKNKKMAEERLLQHLQKSTGKLTEILTVEKEISRVREEIERMEGRRRFLANQTEMTTITVTVQELVGLLPREKPTFGNQIERAFTESVVGLGEFFKRIVLGVIALLPWLVVFGILAFPVARMVRRRQRIKAKTDGDKHTDGTLATGR
jgi:hypothetical protein